MEIRNGNIQHPVPEHFYLLLHSLSDFKAPIAGKKRNVKEKLERKTAEVDIIHKFQHMFECLNSSQGFLVRYNMRYLCACPKCCVLGGKTLAQVLTVDLH